jgi:hypothetical protein
VPTLVVDDGDLVAKFHVLSATYTGVILFGLGAALGHRITQVELGEEYLHPLFAFADCLFRPMLIIVG